MPCPHPNGTGAEVAGGRAESLLSNWPGHDGIPCVAYSAELIRDHAVNAELARRPAGRRTAVSMQTSIEIQALTPRDFEPYGWVLGMAGPATATAVAYKSLAIDFWHEHIFDPGKDGEVEVLWVNYRDNDPLVARLEKHHLTEQALVPLVGAVTQFVAPDAADGTPDLTRLRAFGLSPGIGICMRPSVWHTTRSEGAICLMLTRRSTTADLINHLNNAGPSTETTLRDISPLRLR